jgi:ferredoxin
MIFKVLGKDRLGDLFTLLAEENPVVGPVAVGHDRMGVALHTFQPVSNFSDLALEYTTTSLPAKRFFLPFSEDLATFAFAGGTWRKDIDLHAQAPVVLFGLHPCDINALNKLDKVLLKSDYPMPYYAAKRKNMFIVGLDCLPSPSCFCRSMGADTALHGFDMFLTDLGDRYFVEILSDAAYSVTRMAGGTEPDETDHQAYMKKAEEKNALFTASVDTTDLTKILDMEFQSPVWEHWGKRCFSCGSCASVCPTCYCYGVEETVSLDLSRGKKKKRLHSCNLVDFAVVAGGHNFRPERHARLKYRYYHKHRGFVEAYEESLCVGCGRCGLACLGGITVPEVIASVRKGELRGVQA